MTEKGSREIVLTADDYAMTRGISQAIEQLASAGRISATSAMTTSAHWPGHARGLAAYRDRIAVGLHFDLTLGPSLGAMPRLAPGGRLPDIGALSKLALSGDFDPAEIAAEAERQLDAFETHLGFPPDYLDGHQHVHALPHIRDALLPVLQRRYAGQGFLVRAPKPTIASLLRRGRALPKALALAWLTRGFGEMARKAGFVVNDSFAGISGFRPGDTRADFDEALMAKGPLALVMCHPGFPDAELAAKDPVTTRRRVEYDILMNDDPFIGALWHPSRRADGAPIDWRRVREGQA